MKKGHLKIPNNKVNFQDLILQIGIVCGSQFTAELFVSIFRSFEDWIANTVSSFKRIKNKIIYEK